jgi:predicted amidophosphoribosyltransferase
MSTVRNSGIPLLIRGSRVRSEPKGRYRLGHHQRGAGLGVWSCMIANELRDRVKAWKNSYPYDQARLAEFAESLESLVRLWAGNTFPPRVLVTVPPRGASAFGKAAEWPYSAAILSQAVADRLGFPFALTLNRTDSKRHHGVHYSLAQSAFKFEVSGDRLDMILCIDDLITTGVTMKTALTAIRAAGVPAFGFAYSGHGRGN